MWSSLPLFPAQASTLASRVDNLFFFLVGLTVFFSTLIATLVVVFAVKYRRTHPAQVGAPSGRAMAGSSTIAIATISWR